MSPKEISRSATSCMLLRRIADRFKLTSKSLIMNGSSVVRSMNAFSGKPLVKLSYDDITASAIAKVGPKNDFSHFSGLINFNTGEMHLIELSTCERFAEKLHLDNGKDFLKDGWYPFTVYCIDLGSGRLEIAPGNSQLGGIPIEYAPVFERYMKDLFQNIVKNKKTDIIFYQMKYERYLTSDYDNNNARIVLLAKYLTSKHKALVSNSMSNAELKRFLPKEMVNQIFTSPHS